jgi:L-fuculose-phosphate aldolase
MTLRDLRQELAETARRIQVEKLVTGAGGNLSARHENSMLISPSGFSLEDVAPEQYVEVSVASGEIAPGALRPSSEVLMHLACYRKREDIRAVIHTHAPYTIALTSSGHDLKPMFADSIIYLGRNVPHLDYITVTTPELAAAVEQVIPECDCMVLRNHGAITVGENLKQAFWRACSVEEAARIQLLATLVGTPRFLDEQEADRLESLASEQYRRQLLARMKALHAVTGDDHKDPA